MDGSFMVLLSGSGTAIEKGRAVNRTAFEVALVLAYTLLNGVRSR
jgi:hypothetical protein